jgi:hypothetical protein
MQCLRRPEIGGHDDEDDLVALALGACAFAVLFCFGCGGDRVAVPPTQPTPATVAPAQRETTIEGTVTDTAFRPLAGVRVEVVDGPRAGTLATTDNSGRFSMPGPFSAGSITLAASKDGYVRSTQSLTLKEWPAGVTFWLELTTPSVNITGEYTLTLTADSTCTPPTWESPGWGLPDVAQTRAYTATIA